jgi:hypothetical protein
VLAQAKARRLNPVAIIIDTVFRSFDEGNVNASPDMNVYLAAIAMLTDQRCAVALVHHEIKSGDTPARSVSLIDGADTIVKAWRETETSQKRLWLVELAKDERPSSLRRPAVTSSHRKPPLGERRQSFAPDRSGGTDDLRPCGLMSALDVMRQSFTSVPAVSRHSGDKWRRSYRPRTDGRWPGRSHGAVLRRDGAFRRRRSTPGRAPSHQVATA